MIEGVTGLRQWQISEGFTSSKMVASNTQHGTNRARGVYDWTGQFSAFGAIPPYFPGDYFDLSAYKAPDATGDPDNGDLLIGHALVGSVALTWDFKTNAFISYVVQFGGDGELVFDAGAQPEDSVAPAEFTPCSGKIAVHDGSAETVIPHITQAVLTLTREMKTSVNSGATDGAGKCLTARRPGAALDWTLVLTSEDANENPALASGSVTEIRLYYTSLLFWKLKWGIFEERSNITADRESGDIISQTYNAAMKGFKTGSGVGSILANATVVWPPA